MPWQTLSLEAGELNPQQLSTFFEEQGALSVSFEDAADQPLFEPDPGTAPLWSATRITALFEATADISTLKQRLASTFGKTVIGRLHEDTLQDQDWERAWLDQFHPMQFGRRLWVCPAGQRPACDENAVLIDLDPGLAFGTGTHATTALCLQWLDGHPPVNAQVLDYGCGSGILAIAALKLGAATAWGVDIDRQALWASRENAARNGVAAGLSTGLPDTLPDQCFDVLLANILANPLIELAPRLAGLIRSGGDLVLSGILGEQADAVRAAYERWFSLSETVERDGWVCVHGARN
ncbi:MAG: 50S ribosomal protein L11 methyltransferase [Thiogranum sp.]